MLPPKPEQTEGTTLVDVIQLMPYIAEYTAANIEMIGLLKNYVTKAMLK